MATLVLLNGPPASGKSTLARRLVADRHLALIVDIDVLRSQLGGWLDDPDRAGTAARRVALAMCRAHLDAGHDVVVPQFLGKADFIEALAAVAADSDARFVEVVLQLSRSDALRAFGERCDHPTDSTHHDAAALVGRSTAEDPVGDMYDALQLLVAQRPGVLRVDTVRNNAEQTLQRLIDCIRSVGVQW